MQFKKQKIKKPTAMYFYPDTPDGSLAVWVFHGNAKDILMTENKVGRDVLVIKTLEWLNFSDSEILKYLQVKSLKNQKLAPSKK